MSDALEQARHIIETVQAHMDGKEIEERRKGTLAWYFFTGSIFDFRECEYRVKPEERKPREWVIRPHGLGVGMVIEEGPFVDERVVVREVLPETETE